MFSQRSLKLKISNRRALATVTQEGKHRRVAASMIRFGFVAAR